MCENRTGWARATRAGASICGVHIGARGRASASAVGTRPGARASKLAVRTGALALAVATSGGCAGTLPEAVPTPEPSAGVPGFDTRDYPGDDAMRTWREASPYRWVGYYLESPCYTGTGWSGARERLRTMGWGLAVLFVGEQDWEEILPADQVVADPEEPRCARPNLNAARGETDGEAAIAAASSEGFGNGTTIYLNVERVERVSSDLRDYVRSWSATLLGDGRYEPGLYAHARNAEELHGVQVEAYSAAGRAGVPRLWVASTGGFELERAPEDSGFEAAHVWQGVLDRQETWGGVTLRVDANVARSPDPSG